VKLQIAKARDAALAAVEAYNRPAASFRSGTYIILMVVAWTALFHAIFRHKKTKPYYRKKGSRRFEKVDGDYKAWELSECLRQHFGGDTPAARKNLEFIIGLRNKIEHRSHPHLDVEVFGECQALLMNFEKLLCDTFGDRFALQSSLTFALQLSRCVPTPQAAALSAKLQRQYRTIKQYVDAFRSGLSQDVQNDLEYSFKVFLVPKIGNHLSSSDMAVEFVKYDPSKPEEMDRLERIVALIKPKEVSVTNLGLLKPTEVVQQVQKRLAKKFTLHSHMLCYRHFSIRPPSKSKQPEACDTRFCHYDSLHNDYGYKPAWVDFLAEKLKDSQVYDFILAKKHGANPTSAQATNGTSTSPSKSVGSPPLRQSSATAAHAHA
jgi:hypothetical protein